MDVFGLLCETLLKEGLKRGNKVSTSYKSYLQSSLLLGIMICLILFVFIFCWVKQKKKV